MGGTLDVGEGVSIKDIVKSSSRRVLSKGEAAFLLSADPCEVIKLCSTEKQVEAVIHLSEHYKVEEWESSRNEWSKLLPQKSKRKFFEKDIGL